MNNFTTNLIEVLGKENQEKFKNELTDILLRQVESDITEYRDYLIDVKEISDFFDKCKAEAFENIKKEVIQKYENVLRNMKDMNH